MPQSHCHSIRSFGKSPSLSAIIHGSNPISFEDGIFLPSSCHSRTWLLDNLQDACSGNTSCQVTNCKQDQFTEDMCVQSSCLPRVVQMTCSNSKFCERISYQSGSSPGVLERESQSCQSGSSQKVGFAAQSCQPVSYMAKVCPLKTPVPKSHQTLENEFSQCQSQISESSSCSPLANVVPEPQLLESSSNYEPTCCVTGGWLLPSK